MEHIKSAVREQYGSVARSSLSSATPGAHRIAEAFGYSAAELASIPAEANMGLSCGNPTAMASLKSGEVVLDLGCGGGLDVFLAAQQVGPTGQAIGVDMTKDMIDRASANARKAGVTNVAFHLAEIEALPLADGAVDCVISNCVLNLAPDKLRVFREIHRVLKPGGRLAVSDIALKQPLPEALGRDLAAYVGCIAGAISFDEYRSGLRAAGFDAVEIIDAHADLNAYAQLDDQVGCCSPAMVEINGLMLLDDGGCCAPTPSDAGLHQRLADLMKLYNVNDYAASVKVFALKPNAS